MRPQTHLISSLALAAVRYPRRPFAAIAVVLAGTLIDFDHVWRYAVQTGDWSISGALRYNRYRHRRRVAGDNRPRYGSLRSLVHQPWFVLPPLWWAAYQHRILRPIALGISWHLTLDYVDWPKHYRTVRRAGGRCMECGAVGRRLDVVVRRRKDDNHLIYKALCRPCREEIVAPNMRRNQG